MPAVSVVWERRDSVDRNEMALAALQLCRRWRAHGVESSRFFWLDASKILIFNEGDADSLRVDHFNQDADNAAAGFAMDDLARLTEVRQMVEGKGGQETFQLAGSPTGS